MTQPAYTETVHDGIDVTNLIGAAYDRALEHAFETYQAAFEANIQCPCVRHARALVRASDAMQQVAAWEHHG